MSAFEMKYRVGAVVFGLLFVGIGLRFAYQLVTRGYINAAVRGYRSRQAVATLVWILCGVLSIVAGLWNLPVAAAGTFVSLALACVLFKSAEPPRSAQ